MCTKNRLGLREKRRGIVQIGGSWWKFLSFGGTWEGRRRSSLFLPIFLCSSSFQRQSLPTREPPPPATCSTQLEQVHKLSGRTANLGIPSNTVLFISRGIYSSASMSELRRKIEEDSSLEPIASLRDVNCHTINFLLRNDLLSPSLFTRIDILASKFLFSFHIRLTNYKIQVSFIYASV